MKRFSLTVRPAVLVFCLFFAGLFILSPGRVSAQEFGFGFSEEEADSGMDEAPAGIPALRDAVQLGGTLSFDSSVFMNEDALEEALESRADAQLEFSASGSSVDMLLKLRISEQILSENPSALIDEASLRLYLGRLDLEGGLLKRVWGKADSQGPLDVLNPQDLSDLSIWDSMDRKISQPMFCASFAAGAFTKLEAVYIPGFTPDRLALSGPWMPAQLGEMQDAAYSSLYDAYYESAEASLYASVWTQVYLTLITGEADAETANTQASAAAAATVTEQAPLLVAQTDQAVSKLIDGVLVYPETNTLEYSQGGLRFTTTLGSVDLGIQYFTGFLSEPVIALDLQNLTPASLDAAVSFNRFHQAGLDAAAVLGPYALRAEAALKLTEDFEGDDPLVYNPSLAWSLGFDRSLISTLTLNLQGNGTYRLYDDKVGSEAGDIESGRDLTKTRFTLLLSQSLFQDRFEWELGALYGLEDEDFLIMPALIFAVGDAELKAAAGIFGGASAGELGQFSDNCYVKIGMNYSF